MISNVLNFPDASKLKQRLNTVMESFFNKQENLLTAKELAVSECAPTQLNEHAVCGLIARQLETHCPAGYVPARLTVDYFRPVINAPLKVLSAIVSQTTQNVIADASISQEGQTRVRASGRFLPRGAPSLGWVWGPIPNLPIPPKGCVPPDGALPLSKKNEQAWTHDLRANQDTSRKTAWYSVPPLVDGEPLSPFQRAAVLSGMSNEICHWVSQGGSYVKTDMTLTLSRIPLGYEMGLRAHNFFVSDGISVGTATLYDRTGLLGTCIVTALS